MEKVKCASCPTQGKDLALSLPWPPSSQCSLSWVLKEAIWSICEIGLQFIGLSLSTNQKSPTQPWPRHLPWTRLAVHLEYLRTETLPANLITQPSFSRLWLTFPLSSQALTPLSSGTGHIVAMHVYPTPLLVYVGTVTFPPVFSCALLCRAPCLMLWKVLVSVRSINTVKMSADN